MIGLSTENHGLEGGNYNNSIPSKERVLKLLGDISLHRGMIVVQPAYMPMAPVVDEPDEDERKM